MNISGYYPTNLDNHIRDPYCHVWPLQGGHRRLASEFMIWENLKDRANIGKASFEANND